MIKKYLFLCFLFLSAFSVPVFAESGAFLESTSNFYSAVIILLVTVFFMSCIALLFSNQVGFFSIISMISLLMFFYLQFENGMLDYGAVFCLLVGLILIASEIFIPGGVVGTFGLGAIIYSFFWAIDDISLAISTLIVATLLSIAQIIFLVKVMHKKARLYKPLVLSSEISTEEGFISQEVRTDLLGKIGVTVTDMHPAGKIMIAGARIDAVSEGNYILKGKNVVVVLVDGPRIVVNEVTN